MLLAWILLTSQLSRRSAVWPGGGCYQISKPLRPSVQTTDLIRQFCRTTSVFSRKPVLRVVGCAARQSVLHFRHCDERSGVQGERICRCDKMNSKINSQFVDASVSKAIH